MADIDSELIANDIVMKLREEFLADSHNRFEILDACIVSLLAPDDDGADRLVELQREIHSLKGMGGGHSGSPPSA